MKTTTLLLLVILSTSVCGQTDTLIVEPKTTHETSLGERYTYDEGAKFVVNEEAETEIVEIKDAFVKFKSIDEIVFLTVMYNPSSIFKKKGVEEYRVDSEFFRDARNNTYQAKGSRLNGDGNLRDSYLFIFDPNNSQFTITNVTNEMVEYVFIGQQVPDISEFQKRNDELIKTQGKLSK